MGRAKGEDGIGKACVREGRGHTRSRGMHAWMDNETLHTRNKAGVGREQMLPISSVEDLV